MKTETKLIVAALRILAEDLPNRIRSEEVVSVRPLIEAADRLEELQRKVRNQRREIEHMRGCK